MNQIFKKRVLAASIALLMTPAVYATNGLAPTGLGQVHKAMGGAAVGNPQNTTSLMTNPAAASFVSDGFDVAGELFKPNRTIKNNTPFTASGASPYDAQGNPVNPPPYGTLTPGASIAAGTSYSGDGKSVFFIPEAGYKKTMGNYSIGITAYGNGGMNTQYNKSPAFAADALSANGIPIIGNDGKPTGQAPDHQPDSVFNFNSTSTGPKGTTGVNLEQLFIAPTVSVKLNKKHSVGLSVNLVAQRFEAKGLSALAAGSTDPANFTDRGSSTATGIGATIGWMGQLSDTFTVGASYRMKTKMSKFKEYAGLFPDHGRMDIPAALTVGLSIKPTPATTLAFDLQKIYYSDVHAIGNPFAQSGFGGKDGPGFGWDDQLVYKMGLKNQVNPKLAVMAGFNYGASPVGPEDTFFNALTPAVVEEHLSLGFDYKLSKNSSLVGSYIHTFGNEVKGNPALGQQYDLHMDQDAVGIGYSKTF